MFIVFSSKIDQFDGSFQIVEEAVYIGKKNLDYTASPKEVRKLQYRDEIATVRLARRCGTLTRY